MAWYESEAFWDLGKPFMFGPAAWDRAPGEVDGVLALLGVSPGGHILDLCCGPGRHALELARRGFRVTGVDRYRPYLDSARSAAGTEGLDIDFVECDMLEFLRAEAFDGARSTSSRPLGTSRTSRTTGACSRTSTHHFAPGRALPST
jgi:SAM-dependent methyltransferase